MRKTKLAAATASLLLLSSMPVWAKSSRKPKAPPPSTTEVKPLMAQFLANIQALQPYMSSEKAFSDPANSAEIGNRLSSLARGVDSLNHFDALKTPGFAVSAGVLQDHVRQTNAAFRRGRTEYARSLLNETVQTCISCHSQLPSGASAIVVPPDQVKGSLLDRADFLFATRQFDEALKLYDQVLSETKPKATQGGVIPYEPAEPALKRELAIYLRVRRDPEGAARTLERQLENATLPVALRDSMRQWIAELRKPGLAPGFDPKTVPFAELKTYATKILGEDLKDMNLFSSPSKAASYLLLSGILYETLQAQRKDVPTSDVLFWLAKCDRGLNQDFFFSMSDLYLQECIRRAPHTPIAHKCFREFEESVTLQYTGSRGTDLPDDMQALLASLRRLSR
jgi:hypothetical protein